MLRRELNTEDCCSYSTQQRYSSMSTRERGGACCIMWCSSMAHFGGTPRTSHCFDVLTRYPFASTAAVHHTIALFNLLVPWFEHARISCWSHAQLQQLQPSLSRFLCPSVLSAPPIPGWPSSLDLVEPTYLSCSKLQQ